MQIRVNRKSIGIKKCIDPFIRLLIAFARKIPVDKLGECKNAVDWIKKHWIGPGQMYSYTGGLFKKGDFCFLKNRPDATCEYHTVAILKLPSAYYIVDAAIQQYLPNIKLQIRKVTPHEVCLIGTLQKMYGGRWYAF
ncbi:MAG: hypothetical protein QME05_00990 [Candidatus Margulisbacteria bacterium]|nr:hypothetical protein [Candidatus Margulisiibacteriota bacterium]